MLTRHLAVLPGAKEVKDHQHSHLKTGKTEIRGLGLSHTDDPAGKGTSGLSAGPIIDTPVIHPGQKLESLVVL